MRYVQVSLTFYVMGVMDWVGSNVPPINTQEEVKFALFSPDVFLCHHGVNLP